MIQVYHYNSLKIPRLFFYQDGSSIKWPTKIDILKNQKFKANQLTLVAMTFKHVGTFQPYLFVITKANSELISQIF